MVTLRKDAPFHKGVMHRWLRDNLLDLNTRCLEHKIEGLDNEDFHVNTISSFCKVCWSPDPLPQDAE